MWIKERRMFKDEDLSCRKNGLGIWRKRPKKEEEKKKKGKKEWAVKKENQTGKLSRETKNCFMNDRNHVC